MNLKKKTILVAVVCAMVSLSSLTALASETPFSVHRSEVVSYIVNDTADVRTGAVNVRLTSGQNGARAKIAMSNGTVVASKYFPFYTNVPDLTAEVPSGEIRRVYVEPALEGQTVSGNLSIYLR